MSLQINVYQPTNSNKMSDEYKCGCKGIRFCLLCEQESNVFRERRKNKEIKYIYTYCPECNLCWPDNEETASFCNAPLYLDKLKLHLNFFNKEEETLSISAIDKIPWMPSQSGRRKQDFGPKVNFKKKKVKVGEFKGFPRFTENILHKFQAISELIDFKPVELCNLEYSPERGSCIDPHIDDFWLWGERLVTINLGSSTVLTLVPCSSNTCECYREAHTLLNGSKNRTFSCNHKLPETHLVHTMNTLGVKDKPGENKNVCAENLRYDSKNTVLFNIDIDGLPIASTSVVKSNTSRDTPNSTECLIHQCCKIPSDNENGLCDSKCCSKIFVSSVQRNVNQQKDCNRAPLETSTAACINNIYPSISDNVINTLCNIFRLETDNFKVAVRIVLPPRSLLILAGCARYNWFHEIKRKDVVSRRVAMTFRELTAEFLDGGKESQIGKELLQIANKFT